MENEVTRINDEMVKHSSFIEKYRKQMVNAILSIDAEIDEDELTDVIDEMILERGCSPDVVLDNNYTEEFRNTTLISVLDWVNATNPITAGNGTFYKNQHEAHNPAATMLKGVLADRKALKKQLFKVPDQTSREARDLDMKQGNKKIVANSYYGGSGAKTSSFYSKWSGPATTLSAQSVISTTENMFESFLGDNYYFIDFNELMQWVMVVKREMTDRCKHADFSKLKRVNREDLISRLYSHLIPKEKRKYDDGDQFVEMITGLVNNLSDDEVSFMYYKNNMIKFIDDHSFIKELILEIFEAVLNLTPIKTTKNGDAIDIDWLDKIPKEYRDDYEGKSGRAWNTFVNQKGFIDPNSPPDEIIKPLKKLTGYMMDFVYVRYMAFDRIYRLKNFNREVVTVIDTDSNILSLDTTMRYLIENYFPDGTGATTYGRSYNNNVYIAINMLTYFITTAVEDILLSYGKFANIPEDYRKDYNMKNEFMFAKLIIGDTKKRYISSITLREGNVLNPPKTDIKGFDFKKATCSEYSEKVYTDIIKRRILEPEEIDIRGLRDDVYAFRAEVEQSIRNGEKKFLPNGNVKEFKSYADGSRIQSVKATIAWNLIYPDKEIEPPTKVSLLKMTIFKESDIAKLQKVEPDIYERIVRYIFHDNSGMFVKKTWIQTGVCEVDDRSKNWWKKIPVKYQKEFKNGTVGNWNRFVRNEYQGEISTEGYWQYQDKGLGVLAIPNNEDIPEWTLPYIDMTAVVNAIMAPFVPVMRIFKFKTLKEGKTINGINRQSETISRLVKF